MAEGYHFTKMLLIRHAQARAADGNYGPDIPLTPLGVRQAHLLASPFPGADQIRAIYCSPFPRAVQTATPLAASLSLELVIESAIREFEVDPGPIQEVLSKRTDVLLWRPEQRGARDGETIQQFFSRVADVCDGLCAAHRDETIALVTHAGTIDAIFRWALGIQPDQPWTFEFSVGNASISEIEVWPHGRIDGGPPRHAAVNRLGEAGHLGDQASGI